MENYIVLSVKGFAIAIAGIVAKNIVRVILANIYTTKPAGVMTVQSEIMTNGGIILSIDFNIASFALGLLVGVGFEFIVWLFLLFIGGIEK